MKHLFVIACTLMMAVSVTGCSKSKSAGPGTDGGDTGTHYVDPQLIGTWLWTEASDGAHYNDDGTYVGAAYGLATQYKINADGTGTCFSHIYSSLGVGSELEVNISSTGFFETDNQGHLGYFPLSGTYKSSSGTNRALGRDELYDPKKGTGKVMLYQQLVVTQQGGRTCFQVTSSDNITDTYFKVK